MSEYLWKLNKVLFNVKDDMSLNAISNFLTLEDVEEFLESIGCKCNRYVNNAYKEEIFINDIYELCDVLNQEVIDSENCIYKYKNCIEIEAYEPSDDWDTNGGYVNFYISPYIFYYRSTCYTISLGGTVTHHDRDYSKKWISFLLSKYGKKYADAVRTQFKTGFNITNKKYEDDMSELKTIYEIIIKYEELN